MAGQKNSIAIWMALAALGISLNTVGIALVRTGALRLGLMGLGVILLGFGLAGVFRAAQQNR